jgi:signal recognition particle subunit SRP54
MFDNLTNKLTNSFKVLSGNAKLSEKNIKEALKEVRKSLLEADVAFEVIKDFLKTTEEKALGLKVAQGLNPKQEFIKLVQDELTQTIGGSVVEINLKTTPPAVIMVAGLQGAGKTTSVAKLAKFLAEKHKKKVLLVSADVYRPSAIEQLQILSTQVGCDFFPSDSKQKPEKIVKNAKEFARKNFFDVLIVDTAGRTTVDAEMMAEIKLLNKKVSPIETLFVVDAMTGQDAAHTAKAFGDALPLTGVILTKVDGDARGGAALSVKAITAQPIKFLGVGEKMDGLEVFHPDRLVSRILGMGDILSLIEEIETKVDKKQAAKTASKMAKGKFDFNDMKSQLEQMESMGGMEALMGKIPGMSKIPESVKNKAMGEAPPKKMIAIINSMTKKERIYVNLLNKGSRKQRIAKGSGTSIQDINKLIKQLEKMQKMMKKMSGSKMQKMMQQFGGGSPEGMPDLAEMQKQMAGNIPKMPFRF